MSAYWYLIHIIKNVRTHTHAMHSMKKEGNYKEHFILLAQTVKPGKHTFSDTEAASLVPLHSKCIHKEHK